MEFGNDSLWQVNPQGALTLFSQSISRRYWDYKFHSYDLVFTVDGAWDSSRMDGNLGGIGGNIKSNLNSSIYVFSRVVCVNNAEEAKIEAILHALKICSKSFNDSCLIAICSDAINAIENVRTGLKSYLPQDGRILNLPKLLGNNIDLHFVPRDINEEADQLASKGLERTNFFSYWTIHPSSQGPLRLSGPSHSILHYT